MQTARADLTPPEYVCVLGDTRRRLALFKGTRAAVKRRGFKQGVALICNACSAQCLQALRSRHSLTPAGAPARDNHVSKELMTSLRQILIGTQGVSVTGGYCRNSQHEGNNLSIVCCLLVRVRRVC